MNDAEYDDGKVLDDYITTSFQSLMTELESKVYVMALKRQKAECGGAAADRLPKWIADAGAEVAALSSEGIQVVKTRIRERMLRDLDQGQIFINRCPNCSRIVRTPLARQCLWCGHDWHEQETA
jgi:hypothetical protein